MISHDSITPGTLFVLSINDDMAYYFLDGVQVCYRLYLGEIRGHHQFLELKKRVSSSSEEIRDDLIAVDAWEYFQWIVYELHSSTEIKLYDYINNIRKNMKKVSNATT